MVSVETMYAVEGLPGTKQRILGKTKSTWRRASLGAVLFAVLAAAGAALGPAALAKSNVSAYVEGSGPVIIPVGQIPGTLQTNRAGTRAYVANQGSGTVSVIDTATNSVQATLATGGSPASIAVSRDGSRVYVAGEHANGSGSVSIIDASSNTLTATIDVGSSPGQLETSRDGRYLYVGKIFAVAIVDTTTNTVVSTVPLPESPMQLLLNGDGSRLYMTNQNANSGTVLVLDTATNAIIATIPTKGAPGSMVIDPNLARLYVGEPNWNSVTVINTATSQVSSTTALSGPPMDGSVALDPTGKRLYTKTTGFRLELHDTYTTVMQQSTSLGGPSNIVANVSGRGDGMSISASAATLYMPMRDHNNVTGIPLAPVFADVPAGTKFASEINWLAGRGISTGWDGGNGTSTYRPLTPVSRDAMAAFMYRLAGKPAFTPPPTSPFEDMTTSTQFYTEITWLADREISTGWEINGVQTYRPLNPVNRDAMAAFMYRLAGRPAFTAPANSPFVDVDTGNQFYKEITWLAGQGISTGWDEGGGKASYRPLTAVNRDAMAAFMYRFDSKFGTS